MQESHYWVPIDDNWIQVCDHTVVDNYGNPTGDAVVWYTEFNGSVFIRCFVRVNRASFASSRCSPPSAC
jgi:hypothetical protein